MSPDLEPSGTDSPTVIERSAHPYAAIQWRVTMTELGQVLPPLIGQVFG